MKLLVVLENHFYKDIDGKIYCDRVVDYNYLKRYLDVFSKIIVCGRCQNIEDGNLDKLLVSGKNIEFVALPEFVGSKGLIKNLIKIRKIISETIKNVDCIIYRVPTHISLFTYDIALKQNKPVAAEFMMAANKMIEGKGLIKKILNKLIDKRARKLCMSVNGVSYVTNNILQERYPCKAMTSKSNKYFTSTYSSIDLDDSMFRQKKWEDNKNRNYKIIHIGYMDSYRKGQKILIDALKILNEEGYKIELEFVGDGKKRAEFENYCKEKQVEKLVSFKGNIKNKNDILNLLYNSDMFVFPTSSEGLPRTIIEAMSQGLPCISNNVDGIPELVSKELLVKCNNYKEYADKIKFLIDNPNKMEEYAKINFEKSKEYSKSKLDKKRKEFYTKLKNLGVYHE